MNDTLQPVRGIRIDSIVPGESVPVATAHALRPRRKQEKAPCGAEYQDAEAGYHWHPGIRFRTGIPSGFEPGSGLFANAVSPEEAVVAVVDTPEGRTPVHRASAHTNWEGSRRCPRR